MRRNRILLMQGLVVKHQPAGARPVVQRKGNGVRTVECPARPLMHSGPCAGGSGHMTTLVSHAQRVTKYLGAMAETRSCRLEFLRYEPSKWEASWRAQAAFLQEKACPTMIEQTPLVDKWMAAMKPSFAAGVSAAALPGMESSEVGLAPSQGLWTSLVCACRLSI